MFAEYAKHRESMGNARIATLMIDKYLQRFREQLDNIDNINDKEMENTNEDTTYDNGHFYMPVDDIFYISGRGYVLTGYIESGTVSNGDEVVLNNGIKSTVKGIEQFNKLTKKATKGDSVGLLLADIKKGDLNNTENLIIEKEDGIEYTPEPEIEQDMGHFSMPVENYYQLSGLGFVVGGTIKSGTVHEGDEIVLTNGTKAIVAYVTINRKNVAWATKDEDAELCLGYITESDLVNGTVVEGIDAETQDFEMPITEKSAVKGKGVVLKGTITKGSIKTGDAILLTDEKYRFSTHADEIDIDGNMIDSATEGQSVGIHIHSMTMRSLKNNGLTVRRFSNLDNKE